MRTASIAVLVCLLAGCSASSGQHGGSAPSTTESSPTVLPSAGSGSVTKAAAAAQEACGAFENLIADLNRKPPALNLAAQDASTLTTSGLSASLADPAHWSTLSGDITDLLRSLMAGGAIKPPNPNDPSVAALESACR